MHPTANTLLSWRRLERQNVREFQATDADIKLAATKSKWGEGGGRGGEGEERGGGWRSNRIRKMEEAGGGGGRKNSRPSVIWLAIPVAPFNIYFLFVLK